MYGLIGPKPGRSWHAYRPLCEEGHLEIVQINIERTQYCALNEPTYYWVTQGVGHVGVWPGEGSDEWIEYIPPLVEKPRKDAHWPRWGLYWGI